MAVQMKRKGAGEARRLLRVRGTGPGRKTVGRYAGSEAAAPPAPAGPLPVIRASGKHYDIGGAIGQAYGPKVEEAILYYDRVLQTAGNMTLEEATAQVMKYLPYAEETLPEFVEEIRGIADGARVDFEPVFVINTLEALVRDLPRFGCTGVAVNLADRGEVWLGHNEDWYAEDASRVAVVIAHPEGEPAFLSVINGPLLPAVGFNEEGIGQGVNSVYPTDVRVGVPRTFSSRHVLEARNLGEAMEFACVSGRAGGYNHLLATADGELYNFETTAREFDALYAEDLLAHANHYLSPHLHALSDPPHPDSIIRANRARKLTRSYLAQGLDGRTALTKALTDHVNHPASICSHPQPDEPIDARTATVFSFLVELKSRRAWVTAGAPCQGTYQEFTL
ncbi:MAG TPA: hypothetical protein GX513_11775 [Firmicutes bacterium]|nr:hypothetical protein [Bacillota bacterium]